MVDKRVDQIEEDRWKKLSEEFAILHENEKSEGRQENFKQNSQKFSKTLLSQQIADALDLTLEEIESYLK